jgi:hypothetical protein
MAIQVEIEGRGAARIVSTDGKRVVLDCSAPAPPGASLSCALGDLPPVRVKVTSCKRTDDGTTTIFRIEGRFVDLTREQRARLDAGLQGGSS